MEDLDWIGVRGLPGFTAPTSKGLVVRGEGKTPTSPRPGFLAQRQRHLGMDFRAVLHVGSGVGGIAVRNAEDNWFAIEAVPLGDALKATAPAVVACIDCTWETVLPASRRR